MASINNELMTFRKETGIPQSEIDRMSIEMYYQMWLSIKSMKDEKAH